MQGLEPGAAHIAKFMQIEQHGSGPGLIRFTGLGLKLFIGVGIEITLEMKNRDGYPTLFT
jgi:hypothetical protein